MGICHLAAVQRTNREDGAILMATGGEQVESLLQDLKKKIPKVDLLAMW